MGVDKSQDPSGEDLTSLGLEALSSSSFFCPLDLAGGFFSRRCPASISRVAAVGELFFVPVVMSLVMYKLLLSRTRRSADAVVLKGILMYTYAAVCAVPQAAVKDRF